jgi:RHS repeat-associated protein
MLYQEDNKQSKRLDYIYLGNRLVAYRERPLSSDTVTVKYQHTDALGSPIAVTNTAKALIESSEYEPFGQLVNKPLFDGPGYTGHVQDAATGLTYMQQRYYDPGIGRFLSVDPVTAYEQPGQNFNRYWYANNNPFKLTDPDGRLPLVVAPALAGAARCAASAPCCTTVATGAKTAANWVRNVVAGAGLIGTESITEHNESAEGASQQDADNDRKPKDDRRLGRGEIKKLEGAGHDVHELKGRKNASKQDLFKDKNGEIYVKPKDGSGPGEPTGININDLDNRK